MSGRLGTETIMQQDYFVPGLLGARTKKKICFK